MRRTREAGATALTASDTKDSDSRSACDHRDPDQVMKTSMQQGAWYVWLALAENETLESEKVREIIGKSGDDPDSKEGSGKSSGAGD